MRNSLAFRIAYAGMAVGSITLLMTAVLLVFFFHAHIEKHFDTLLFDHIEELVAASSMTPDDELDLNWRPLDPRFNHPESGWYWEISLAGGEVLMNSQSLVDKRLSIVPVRNGDALKTLTKNRMVLSKLLEGGSLQLQQFSGPYGKLLRSQMLKINYPQSNKDLVYIVTGPASEIEQDVWYFLFQVIVCSLVFFFGLVIAVITQVRIAMRPLRSMQQAINDVHQGNAKKLPDDFPGEIQIVVNELNGLLAQSDNLLERAKFNIGNLAHAIKNPLTVIRNEAKKVPGQTGALIEGQAAMIAGNLDRHLAHARAAATLTILGSCASVKEIVEDLRFLMERLHQDRNIRIHTFDLEGRWFRGEVEGLEEMVGNLMDNACKWALDQVWVHAELENERLLLFIEDNGPGVPEKKLGRVLQRGRKLDETVSGHGLGLHIVHDIVDLYGGSLKLERSSHGGLCAILELPAAQGLETVDD